MKREYQHQNVFYLFCSVALTALLIVLISFSANAQTVNPSEYDVFNGCLEFSDSQNALYKYLAGQVFEFTKNRSKNVGAIQTLDGWKNRQKIVAETLKKDIGAFPEKTPLNAKVVKVIKKDGFRIEHIVFESMPNYYVTASMFIPSNLKKKAPAIIYCVGHVFLGDVSSWMMNTLAGINYDSDNPGFRKILFTPHFVKDLNWAKGEYHSINGYICSEWKREGAQVILTVTVPLGTEATVKVKDQIIPLQSGVHKLKFNE